ncbi:hypothetical protein RHGRI_032929 [Rhododendron griersonianum]|uniref:Trafficking protein particle complex subunit n=1 Tax=Rhododendron griersonianum TaxID=479676 RepID=A0AAV6IEA4_9ERIC|nr:hypothetical protein RHGRI_032929 [Rhododendron griersonianum]
MLPNTYSSFLKTISRGLALHLIPLWFFSFVYQLILFVITVNNPKKSGPTLNETFLGLLYPTENYKVYGYLTNTKVKFILVTTDLDVRDADVRNVNGASAFTYFSLTAFEEEEDGDWEERSKGLYLTCSVLVKSMEKFFRRFHSAYVDAVSNPFHVPGKKITSRTFAERVSGIVKSFGLSSAG